jgi:hypothetical protein
VRFQYLQNQSFALLNHFSHSHPLRIMACAGRARRENSTPQAKPVPGAQKLFFTKQTHFSRRFPHLSVFEAIK